MGEKKKERSLKLIEQRVKDNIYIKRQMERKISCAQGDLSKQRH